MVDVDGIFDELKDLPHGIINLRVLSPWLLKKPLFGVVINVTLSVLNGFS